MASITYRTYLMYDTSSTSTASYKKLVDIKSYGDLRGTPDRLDTTTMSNANETGIPGIAKGDTVPFNCNYDPATYNTIKALEGAEKKFALYCGGTEGQAGVVTQATGDSNFTFSGYVAVTFNGKGVNEVREMTVNVIVSSDVAHTAVSGT